MPISFANIPSNIKIPLYWVEVDPSMAGLPTINLRALLVGTMLGPQQMVGTAIVAAGGTNYAIGNTITLANGVVLTVLTLAVTAVATVAITNPGNYPAGTPPTNPQAQVSTSGTGTGATFTLTWVPSTFTPSGVVDVPVAVGTQAQADDKFGPGSELSRMFKAYFANNFANEVWAGPVAEPVGGTQSTGTITVATPPIEAGTIELYIGGEHLGINVGGTDTTAIVATAIAAAINANINLPVTATVATNVVTLKCVWKGINGNDIRVETNYYGGVGGETTPTGLTLTLPASNKLSGGAGTPVFTNLINNMGEDEFEYVALPYTDSTSLQAWEFEYGFGDSGRWGWQRQHFGHVFSSKRDTYSNLVTFGLTRNSGVVSIMAFEVEAPTPMYEMTAAYTAKAQRALSNDPARPLQTLQLVKCLPAPLHKRFDFIELNSLAHSGLAIQKCWPGSAYPMIAREQTTYQLNLYGYGDDAYELVTTLATLAKLLRNQRHAITSKYPRHKLADDGTRFGPGQAIVTPGIIKAELVAEYRMDMYNGLVENLSQFKKHLIVERDPNDPNRLNVLYPPDLINQLRIFAVLAQFRLQYNRGIDVEIIGTSSLTGTAGNSAGGAIIGQSF
jgi:phage tail sheath gpL-like